MSQLNTDVLPAVVNLQAQHRAVSEQVRKLQLNPSSDDAEVRRLKKQKLKLKQEIVSQGGTTGKTR